MIEDVRNRNKLKVIKKVVVKGDDVLLKVDRREQKSEFGIIIALDQSREANAAEEGIIVQFGMTAFSHLPKEEQYKVGDKVAITRYSGKNVGKDAEGYDLVCIVDTGLHGLILEE